MARVSFYAADGEETSYKLFPQRPLHIGRDPGNDVVLRDAKVSRRHAQILFERGFFVLHDLESANGTYVNGKKIHVAPLTNGAELKLGNSKGRFTEELGGEVSSTAAHEMAQIVAADLPGGKKPGGGNQRDDGNGDGLLASIEEVESAGEPLPAEDSLKKRLAADRIVTIDRSLPTDSIVIRGNEGTPLFFLKRASGFAYLISALMLMMVLVAGSAVTLFLALEKRALPATFALVLTGLFIGAMTHFFPRRSISLFLDESHTSTALVLEQEGALAFPRLSFIARGRDGELIGRVKKNAIRSLARKRWQLLVRAAPAAAVVAIEDSAWRSILRRLVGNGFGRLLTNYDIATASSHLALLRRRDQDDRDVLEWRAPASGLDGRLIAAFLAVLYSVERA